MRRIQRQGSCYVITAMKGTWRVPARLSVTVVISAACSAPLKPSDAARGADTAPAPDARADAVADALADVVRDVPMDADDALADIPHDTSCFKGDRDPLAPDPGYTCAPRPGTTARCPAERVCDPGECPAGCESCMEPFVCQPDREGAMCANRYACSLNGCSDGCRAIG